MNEYSQRITSKAADQAMRAAAFDLSPEPALIISADGRLAAANEAAEALFGQGLGLLARGRFRDAMPAGSTLVALLERAQAEGAPVRERGLLINLFGQAPFEADGAAKPVGDGSVLLTLHQRAGALSDRASDNAGLRSVMGLGRMLAH